jgi:hypothetical protein
MRRVGYHIPHHWRWGCAPRGLRLARALWRLRRAERATDSSWTGAGSCAVDLALVVLEELALGPVVVAPGVPGEVAR